MNSMMFKKRSNWRPSTGLRRGLQWWLMVSLAIKLLIVGMALFSTARVPGQNSSLFHHDLPAADQELRLSNSSWLFQKSDPPTQVRLHDLITIVVNEKSAVT